MYKKIVIGIVGAGYSAHLRAYAIRKIPGDRIRIKGVYDINGKHLSEFSKEILSKSYQERCQKRRRDSQFDLTYEGKKQYWLQNYPAKVLEI